MTTGKQPNNPYEPPEHGGPAAANGPLRQPINRRKVVRAVLIWFGFIGFSGAINVLYILTSVPEQFFTWPTITLMVIGMLNLVVFLLYNILLLVWITSGRFRTP